ncbi:choline/carnitine O-acyltransferase [Secundilactobacillus odoratitofui]|uniref:choline/carnitine O-acyltransferase n=1 Tax=Secundilactobacillus odoratitofui TaxID=480930 RepID=UPI002093CECF
MTGGWHRLNEPVSMRHFYQGRPESLNTLSTSAKQFVTDFASGQRDAAIRQSFNQAITQHTAAIQEVQEGNGTDQHLLGLQTMMNTHGGKAAFPDAAELFDSDVYQQLTTNFFATLASPATLSITSHLHHWIHRDMGFTTAFYRKKSCSLCLPGKRILFQLRKWPT